MPDRLDGEHRSARVGAIPEIGELVHRENGKSPGDEMVGVSAEGGGAR